MNVKNRIVLLIAACAIVTWTLLQTESQSAGFPQQGSQTAEPVVVTLCDGKTEVIVPGLRPGEKLDRERAQKVADLMIAEWLKSRPGAKWQTTHVVQAKGRSAARPAAPNAQAQQVEVYNRFTPRDEMVWKTELDKFVKEGDRVFHDADAFGGTIGVSCDMCHPNASNTHAETYPKYQVQLQRVALLRDMINWCIQHPTKGKPLPDDDPRLRAMEAYIMSQRAGKAIVPGKH